jgi:DNA-binding transcriptional LysR family regulator
MNLAGVDLNLLTAFEALMKDGQVTGAGVRVGLSQPAMSHALGRLRQLFGDELFVRTPAGMEPTARARALAEIVAPALIAIRRALDPSPTFDPAVSERGFTVGMAEYAEIALIKGLAQGVAAHAPRADLRVVPMTKADYAARLDSGTLDLAIGHLVDPPPRLARAALFQDPLVCVARADHPAFRRRLTVAGYVLLDHVLVSPTGEPHGPVDRMLGERGLRRRVALVVGTYLTLPIVLGDSDLVATMPARAARMLAEVSGLAVRPLPLRGSAKVAMVWHRRNDGEPAIAWVRALVARVAGATKGVASELRL